MRCTLIVCLAVPRSLTLTADITYGLQAVTLTVWILCLLLTVIGKQASVKYFKLFVKHARQYGTRHILPLSLLRDKIKWLCFYKFSTDISKY
jgi:hypothetical protein